MRSPSVLIDGYYWHIKVYPRGNEGTPLMSVYIECSTSPDIGLAADPVGTAQAAGMPKTGDGLMSSTADNRNTSDGNFTNASRPTPSTTNDSNLTETPQALLSKDQAFALPIIPKSPEYLLMIGVIIDFSRNLLIGAGGDSTGLGISCTYVSDSSDERCFGMTHSVSQRIFAPSRTTQALCSGTLLPESLHGIIMIGLVSTVYLSGLPGQVLL